MDREQEERRFLGFFGILKESIKVIFTWRKIFSQITLAFILPLSLMFFAHTEVSTFLFAKILPDLRLLNNAEAGTVAYNKLSDSVTWDQIGLLLFEVISFIVLAILSFISTCVVICTTACVYTLKSITFRGVMSVLPKVWKRLMITSLWGILAFFVYIVVSIVIFSLFTLIPSPAVVVALVSIFFIIYLSGAGYISAVLSLASVVSVVENIYGIEAMFKSKNLIKGKLGVSIAIYFLLWAVSMTIQSAFYIFVAHGHGSIFLKLGVAILCFLLLIKLVLFSLVVHTVIYFVCKSYHHENIDKSLLADHLDVHLLADYLPPKGDDV